MLQHNIKPVRGCHEGHLDCFSHCNQYVSNPWHFLLNTCLFWTFADWSNRRVIQHINQKQFCCCDRITSVAPCCRKFSVSKEIMLIVQKRPSSSNHVTTRKHCHCKYSGGSGITAMRFLSRPLTSPMFQCVEEVNKWLVTWLDEVCPCCHFQEKIYDTVPHRLL